MGHLVGGLIAAAHTFWRGIGIARIGGRIVIAEAHRNYRALGQEQRLSAAVHGLPVEVPVGNPDEPPARSIGQGREALKQLAKIVRVRVDGKQVGIERQAKVVRYQEIAVARRNVERAIVLQLRVFGLRLAREIKSDRRLYQLGLAGGPEVNVEDQVVARIEAPRHAGGLFPGRSAGLPEKEVAIGIEGIGCDRDIHAGEALAAKLLAIS